MTEDKSTNNEEGTFAEDADDNDEDDEDENMSAQPLKLKVLLDPRTGIPLRDQTVPAEDTGYLGNHVMQDKTETLPAKDEADEDDFKE